MILDALLPPVCLACGLLLSAARVPELCRVCAPELALLTPSQRDVGGIVATHAYEGPLARALARCKYQGDAALAGALGRVLARDPYFVCDHVGRPWDLVVAVPMHGWRRLLRGYDHAQLILRMAARHRRGPRVSVVLCRTRNSPAQVLLAAGARAHNVVGAFEVPPRCRARVQGRRVLVVDDVTTTGATLRAAMAGLTAAGAAATGALALMRTT